MTHESFVPGQGFTERRKGGAADIEVITKMHTEAIAEFRKISDETLGELRQAIKDQDALGEIHRQHVDALLNRVDKNIDTMAKSNEKAHEQMDARNAELLEGIKDLIGVQSLRFSDAIDRLSDDVVDVKRQQANDRIQTEEEIRKVREEIGSVKKSVETLEQAPAKAAEKTVNATKEKIFGAIIASAILGGGAVGMAVYNWVKLILEGAAK